ncbi:hypothetical protein FPV67DRAFT_1677791 [Lyophyllum atratum]|nr:hypothetical protein FPV67DRAFT_1677791 [Lyophyllum atratum]
MPKASNKPPPGYNTLWYRLKRQQRRFDNITSFFPHPAPGEIGVIPYPITPYGSLVPANMLWLHMRTHDFPTPRCFHDMPARTFVIPSGPYEGCAIAACGHSQKAECCPFWINFTYIEQDRSKLVTRLYERKNAGDAADTTNKLDSSSDPGTETVIATGHAEDDAADAQSDADADEDIHLVFLGHWLSSTGVSSCLTVSAIPAVYMVVMAYDDFVIGSLNPYCANTAHLPSTSHSPSTSEADETPVASSSLVPPAYVASGSVPASPPAYSLTLPSSLYNCTHALVLNPLVQVDVTPRHITPDRGNLSAVHALDSEEGLPADIFWRMFVLCRRCDHVMTGANYEDHACDSDLTK